VNVAQLLAIPYIRGSESVASGQVAAGARTEAGWTRRFTYPELPGCLVESLSTLEGLLELERVRVTVILNLLVRGERVPRPRPPLHTDDMRADLLALGINLDEAVLALDESAAPANSLLAAAILSLPSRRSTGRMSR
jgi:hypothetical protein